MGVLGGSPEYLPHGRTQAGDRHLKFHEIRDNLRRPPSAVFAANDASAFGMLSAGRSVRLAVPEKLSVIGFDNTTMAQSEFVGSPPSTTPQGDG